MTNLIVGVKKLHDDAKVPVYKYLGDSGADLYSYLPDMPVEIEPGKWKLIPTGIAIELCPGYEAQIRSRSGLAIKNGLFVLTGTIDNAYRGQVGVVLANLSDESFFVGHHERIAQLVVSPIQQAQFAVINEFRISETSRAENGFGSSGIK